MRVVGNVRTKGLEKGSHNKWSHNSDLLTAF